MVEWELLMSSKCPGCSRPISQHLQNHQLGREEVPEDYEVFSIECPATQAISEGQHSWSKENSRAIKLYHEGKAPDPSSGLYWLARCKSE